MPALQVRDFPEDVYLRLKEQAKLDRRSLSQEVVYYVVKGLDEEDRRYVRVGDRMYRETRASWLKHLDDDPEELERRAKKREELFARIKAMGPIEPSDDGFDSARLVRESRAENDRRLIEAASYLTEEEKQAEYEELDRYVRGE